MSSTDTRFVAFTEYEPNEAACIVFIGVFIVLFIAHVWQSIRARIWYMWPLIVATAFEAIGYILRELAIRDRYARTPYIVSQVVIVMSPAFFAANLYMLVGRAIVYVGPGYAILRPSLITPIFVGLDILAIATQGGGSGIIFGGSDVDRMKMGRMVLIGGLFIQLIAFGVFLLLAIYFDWKTTVALRKHVAFLRPLMNAFYISGTLILLRSIYRAIEFITLDLTQHPINSYLYNTEWPYYVLDALPIAVAVFVYNIFFPAKYLPHTKHERLQADSEIPLKNGHSHV